MIPTIKSTPRDTRNSLRLSPFNPCVSLRDTKTEMATGTPAVAKARIVV